MITVNFSSQLIILSLLIISYTIEGNVNRHRRQILDGTNRNIGILPQKSDGSIPLNNVQAKPLSNPTVVFPSGQTVSQSQVAPSVRSNGYYNSAQFQPPPFSGEKPLGWFGTNHLNWVSNQYTEIDKNKLAADRYASGNNPQANVNPPQRDDGGPHFLRKVARQYADKGVQSFNFGPNENRQGQGSICTNHENFDGYKFGSFACPLPASTGMNQLDQFCCGPINYQYCCNAQEYSHSQRGGFVDTSYIGDQRFPKLSTYSPATKKILAVIIPISGVIVIVGISVFVFLYYRKFRKEQSSARKPAGAVRLDDNYSIVPQDLPADRSNSPIDDL